MFVIFVLMFFAAIMCSYKLRKVNVPAGMIMVKIMSGQNWQPHYALQQRHWQQCLYAQNGY